MLGGPRLDTLAAISSLYVTEQLRAQHRNTRAVVSTLGKVFVGFGIGQVIPVATTA